MESPSALESSEQIAELTHAVQDLRRRVEALERRTDLAVLPQADGVQPAAIFESRPVLPSGLLAGIGRVLLGIAGAYLLRAITEARIVPPLAGTLAAVFYAYAWLIPSRRSVPGARWAAPLYALTASVILAPLLWEATLGFRVLTPAAAAAALAGLMLLGQLAAWGSDSAWPVAIVLMAGSAAALAFLIATLNPLPFAIALTASAALVELAASRDRLTAVRWLAAIPADFCAFLLAYLITRPRGIPEGYAPVPVAAVMAILWMLAAIYVGSISFRTLARRHRIGWFEIGQSVIVIAVAIGTTLRIAEGRGIAVILVGAGCALAAAASYTVAGFTRADISRRNNYVFAGFGFVFTLLGGALLLRGLLLAALWSILALIMTDLGDYWRTNILRAHGAFYLVAAVVGAGLITWTPATGAAVLMAVSSGLVFILILWKRGRTIPPWPERVPAAVAAALLCWSLVSAATGSLTASLVGAPVNRTLRTGVICGVAVVLAWIGSRRELKELVGLLYPWMIFGVIKLLLDDVNHGESAALFVSLFVYGVTLISLPRLLRSKPAS